MVMAFFHLSLFATLLSLSSGITVDFIRRDSPGSPSYDPSKTRFERLRTSFERSVSRHSNNDLRAPLRSDLGEYLMKIAIGTPPVEFLGIADTGSDLTWIQCLPCINCYSQTEPFFDPAKSQTYKPLPCSSQPCSQLSAKSCGPDRACNYRYSYGDSSYTNGDLSLDTLTFVEPNHSSFPDVAFGCGHDNAGTFTGSGSGLIGLGGGPFSIINQLSKSIGGKFSYCLTTLGSNVTSKISFGGNAIVSGVSTPLVRKNPATFYYITLEGFSVGNKRVDYGSVFSVSKGNIIIDSGTTLTYLPPGLYNGLESALVGSVNGTRVADSRGRFKLCYDNSSGFRVAPVTMHFAGADVEVEMEMAFVEVGFGLVCFTMVPATTGLAILGNFHQMNYLIGYDVVGQKLSFLKTDCDNYK